jgi:hypothetical protein
VTRTGGALQLIVLYGLGDVAGRRGPLHGRNELLLGPAYAARFYHSEVTPPMPLAPGRPARQNYEYQRGGVCNLFLVTEPLAGWRRVTVSNRRTRIDWAHYIKDLVDVHYPDAEQIVLVQDNLNTHTPASLYEAFAPAEARRLADKLELHYTPGMAAG